MNEVNKTLYIPLYGKSKVSQQGIILNDPSAERICEQTTSGVICVLGDDGSGTVFVVNRDLKEDSLLDLDLRAFGDLKLQEHILLHHDNVKAVNTEEHPDTVIPMAGPGGTIENGRAQIRVSALSWNVLRFSK